MKKTILIVLLLTLVSCKMVNRMVINHYANTFKITRYTNGDKEIAYLPMVHLSKLEFYEKVKRSVDSLRALNYTVFYEGIAPNEATDSIAKAEMWKKLRKVVGFYPDYSNKELFKSLAIKGYVKQTLINTGVNGKTDVHADLPLNELIAAYEKGRGEIQLSEYDRQTPLNQKYKAGKINQENSDYLIQSLRNDHLAKMVIESKARKIAILYGKLHMYELAHRLKQSDSLWHYKSILETDTPEIKSVID